MPKYQATYEFEADNDDHARTRADAYMSLAKLVKLQVERTDVYFVNVKLDESGAES